MAAAANLIDEHVDVGAVERASAALSSYIATSQKQQNEDELLGAREDFVWLVLSTKRMSPEKKLKPQKIPLAHPLIDPRTNSICLIVKDPQREYKDLLESKGIKFITRVVGLTKLKGKFKPFEARRQLLNDHGLFLADDRVVPMLPQLLGKMFFDAKKQPIPVNITKSNIKTELEKAISATYMHQNKGTCTSIKVASTSHTTAQIVKNLTTAIPAIVSHTPDGWDNVQSIHIKTSQSVSLPIWTCDLAAGERWTGALATTKSKEPIAAAKASEGSESKSESEADQPAPEPTKAKAKAAPAASAKASGKRRREEGITDAESSETVPQKRKAGAVVAEAKKAKKDAPPAPKAIKSKVLSPSRSKADPALKKRASKTALVK